MGPCGEPLAHCSLTLSDAVNVHRESCSAVGFGELLINPRGALFACSVLSTMPGTVRRPSPFHARVPQSPALVPKWLLGLPCALEALRLLGVWGCRMCGVKH